MTLSEFVEKLPKDYIERKKIYQEQNMLNPEGNGNLIRYQSKYYNGLVLKLDCETNAKCTLIEKYKDKVESLDFTWTFEQVLERWKALEIMCKINVISGLKFNFDDILLLEKENAK